MIDKSSCFKIFQLLAKYLKKKVLLECPNGMRTLFATFEPFERI